MDVWKTRLYYWTSKPMAHIYGHSWPVRWGNEGEEKMIKVYSNCDAAELFVNGESLGIKKRNSQDFPAAGLRWNVPLKKGQYEVKVVAKKGKETITDAIRFEYQTEKWTKPAQLELKKVKEENGVVTLQAQLLDAKGVCCLDATDWIRFGLTGDGRLLDDLGTSSGSRYVQFCNGRALISVEKGKERVVVSARSGKLPLAFLDLQ